MSALDDDALNQLRHDLRSPLFVIGGFAQLLASERPLDEDDRREYAERIRRAAEDVSAILRRALGE